MTDPWFSFLFAAAQGAAIFGTAFVAATLLNRRHWAAKTALMAASFILWITFTFVVMFWGVSSYLLFYFLVMSAALSTAVYWLLWILVPLARKAFIPGRAATGMETR